MQRPYKTILIISFFLTILMLGLLSTQSDHSVLYLVFFGLSMFTVFSACFGAFYYFAKKEDKYYREILTFSACLTIFLFSMDYMFWDKNPPNPSAKQIIFEFIVIGTSYTGLFFGAFSGIYFGIRKTGQFITAKLGSKKNI